MAKFCTNCGAAMTEGAKFCTVCGFPVHQSTQSQQPPQAQPPQTRQAPPQAVPPPRPKVYIPQEFLDKNAARSGQGSPRQPQPPQQAQQPQPVRQQTPVPPYQPPQQAQQQPKQNRRWILAVTAVFLAAVFLFTAFVAPGFLRGDGGDPGSTPGYTKPATEKTESGSVNEDQPAATLCGVTVDVAPYMLADGGKTVSVSKLESTTDADGIKSDNYELDMGSHERFKVPVEVTFPCKTTEGFDPSVEHYNEETGEWEPLFSFVDEANQTVTAYFGSFSPARVSYLPVGVDPRIYRVVKDKDNEFAPKIALASNYWKILQRIHPDQYSDEVTKFINNPDNYAIKVPELDPKMDAKAAYEAFTKSNTIWTFLDPLINLGINDLPSQGQNAVVKFIADNSESLSNAMSVVPFIMMSAQVAFDLNSGEPDAMQSAAVNLYKNLITSSGTIYSLSTGYSHIGFTLAFFGVALFGMELDYLVDAAKAEQKANVKSVFDSYYTNTVPFDANHWYDVFENAYWNSDGNAEAAMRALKEAVDAYCNQFWDKIYSDEGSDAFWEALSDSEYRKVFMNATPEDKAALTEQQKSRVWNMIQKHSMKIIRRFLLERLQEDTGKELSKITEMYNLEKTITIQENVNRGAEAQLPGYTVCLGFDTIPSPNWHVNIPDEGYEDGWRIDFECTVYGYMQMGMPYQVLFYLDEEEFREAVQKGERPSFIYPFLLSPTSKNPSTLVEINFGDPYQAKSDDFTGYDWTYHIDTGGEISSSIVNGAIQDAIDGMNIKLDKEGNFTASGSGSSSEAGTGDPGPNDSYNYGATATVQLSGHIDKGTGDGTFSINISVSYHHTKGSSYSGTDTVTATVTVKGGGDIKGEIQGDDTFDPVFTGDGTVTRSGSWSHRKGSAQWDHDGQETINNTDDTYFKLLFIANN